jgi:hypothetical protein
MATLALALSGPGMAHDKPLAAPVSAAAAEAAPGATLFQNVRVFDSDGNPIENVALIGTPKKSFLVIMKNGKIYKNLLAP